jgi:hypothetical protein
MGWGPPDWVVIYHMAEKFGAPPWEIEANCTKEWLERHLTYSRALAQERERTAKQGAKHGKRDR